MAGHCSPCSSSGPGAPPGSGEQVSGGQALLRQTLLGAVPSVAESFCGRLSLCRQNFQWEAEPHPEAGLDGAFLGVTQRSQKGFLFSKDLPSISHANKESFLKKEKKKQLKRKLIICTIRSSVFQIFIWIGYIGSILSHNKLGTSQKRERGSQVRDKDREENTGYQAQMGAGRRAPGNQCVDLRPKDSQFCFHNHSLSAESQIHNYNSL